MQPLTAINCNYQCAITSKLMCLNVYSIKHIGGEFPPKWEIHAPQPPYLSFSDLKIFRKMGPCRTSCTTQYVLQTGWGTPNGDQNGPKGENLHVACNHCICYRATKMRRASIVRLPCVTARPFCVYAAVLVSTSLWMTVVSAHWLQTVLVSLQSITWSGTLLFDWTVSYTHW